MGSSRARAVPRGVLVVLVVAGLAVGVLGAWRLLHDPVGRWRASEPVPSALARQAERDEASGSPSATATPAPAPAVRPVRPRHLFVPDLGINAPVTAKGTTTYDNPFTGTPTTAFGIPDNSWSTTWWSDGPEPGAPGLAIILGHSEIGTQGVFDEVVDARPGSVIGVEGEDGRLLRFRVLGVTSGIPKRDPGALSHLLEDPPADARLALVTCSGSISAELSSHDDNTVAFAALVDELPRH